MGIISEDKAKVKPGQEFDRWTVLGWPFVALITNRRKSIVVCECKCGVVAVVYQDSLLSGKSGSCGCGWTICATKHGYSSGKKIHRLYQSWTHLIHRCYNKNSNNFAGYGGRGIRVCEDWRNTFESFRDWALANGYADNLTIDRIDVNGNYEPTNCRWATAIQQGRNRRNNVRYKAFGEEKTIREWSEDERCLCCFGTLETRILKLRMDINKAITTKPNLTKSRKRKVQHEDCNDRADCSGSLL